MARSEYWAWTVATFFGAGFGKPGPGTWGSVAAVLLWAAYAWVFHPRRIALLLALLRRHRPHPHLRHPRRHHRRPRIPPPRPAIRRHRRGRRPMDRPALQPRRLAPRPHRPRCSSASSISPSPFPSAGLKASPSGWGIVFDDVAAGLYALGVASLLHIWF